jgi:hypothetical protein
MTFWLSLRPQRVVASQIYLCILFVRICVYLYTYVYIYMYLHIYIYVNILLHVWRLKKSGWVDFFVCIYNTYIFMYIYVFMCIFIFMYMICIHIYIHIYICAYFNLYMYVYWYILIFNKYIHKGKMRHLYQSCT